MNSAPALPVAPFENYDLPARDHLYTVIDATSVVWHASSASFAILRFPGRIHVRGRKNATSRNRIALFRTKTLRGHLGRARYIAARRI